MRALLAAVAVLASGGAALAQDKLTVDSLLAKGAKAIGVMPSNAGPGIVLAITDAATGNEQLYMCFVAETPGSADIATQYCKPVH